MNTPDPLVSAEWLLENINAPDIRVVDATWFAPWVSKPGAAKSAYNEAHIPGAVFFDIDDIADPDSDLPHMLPSPVLFSSRVRKLGIGDGNRIVLYDQNGFFASARAWWMLRVMGHEEVYVLDGGLAAWTNSGGELEDLPPVAVERHFTARVRADLVKDADQVLTASAGSDVQIFDARPVGRFTGDDAEPREDLSSGHIPGSLNVPSTELVDAFGYMKPAAELEALIQSPAAPTICTCGSGVSAAVIALALARLGNHGAAVYDGSWSEWAADPARPIAKGPA